jgi:2-oxoglutarate ferredoxin oxidoreductase subunit gamma
MYQGIIMSGFGGQGIISAGILLAYAGMKEGKHVTFFPAYGAEMRGGTANCSVVVSSEEIASPVVAYPDTLIVMNEPSLTKFEPSIRKGGLLLINSSLVAGKPKRDDVKVHYIQANEIAEKLGTTKIANMVMLGAYSKITGAISIEGLRESLKKVFPRAKQEIIDLDTDALKKGMEAV